MSLEYGHNNEWRDFAGSPVVKNPLSNAGDVGLIPGGGTEIPLAVGVAGSTSHNYWAQHNLTRESVHCNERSQVPTHAAKNKSKYMIENKALLKKNNEMKKMAMSVFGEKIKTNG